MEGHQPMMMSQPQHQLQSSASTPMGFVPGLSASLLPRSQHTVMPTAHPLQAPVGQQQQEQDDPLQKILSEYREKYLQGMEERIWLYQELVQKGEVLRQKEALIQEAVAHARLLETQIAEKRAASQVKEEERDTEPIMDYQFGKLPAAKRQKHAEETDQAHFAMSRQHQKTPKISSLHQNHNTKLSHNSNVNHQSHKNGTSTAKLKSKLNKKRYEPANISFDELEASTPLTPPRPVSTTQSHPQSSSKDTERSQVGYKKTPLAKKPAKKSSSVKKKTSATPKKPTPKVEPKPIKEIPHVNIDPSKFEPCTEDLKKTMVSWSDIIRNTHPSSLSFLNYQDKIRLEQAVHEFLSTRFHWKDIQYCVALPWSGKDKRDQIAIPEGWADDFSDFLSERIEQGLMNRSRAKGRRKSAPLPSKNDSDYQEFAEFNSAFLLESAGKRSWLELIRVHIPNFRVLPMHVDFVTEYFQQRHLPEIVVQADLNEDNAWGLPLELEQEFLDGFYGFFHYNDRRPKPKEGAAATTSTISNGYSHQSRSPRSKNAFEVVKDIQLDRWDALITGRFLSEFDGLLWDHDLRPTIVRGIVSFLRERHLPNGLTIDDCKIGSKLDESRVDYGIPQVYKEDFENWFCQHAADRFCHFKSSEQEESLEEEEEEKIVTPKGTRRMRVLGDEEDEDEESDQSSESSESEEVAPEDAFPQYEEDEDEDEEEDEMEDDDTGLDQERKDYPRENQKEPDESPKGLDETLTSLMMSSNAQDGNLDVQGLDGSSDHQNGQNFRTPITPTKSVEGVMMKADSQLWGDSGLNPMPFGFEQEESAHSNDELLTGGSEERHEQEGDFLMSTQPSQALESYSSLSTDKVQKQQQGSSPNRGSAIRSFLATAAAAVGLSLPTSFTVSTEGDSNSLEKRDLDRCQESMETLVDSFSMEESILPSEKVQSATLGRDNTAREEEDNEELVMRKAEELVAAAMASALPEL